jgi:uncharacterized membrane protein
MVNHCVDAIHNRVQRLLGVLALWINCHQRADRSYTIRGRQIPVCNRCLGILFGLTIAPFFTLEHRQLYVLLTIPMVSDGLTQLIGIRESRNWLRLSTGIAFGFGFCRALILMAVQLSAWNI